MWAWFEKTELLLSWPGHYPSWRTAGLQRPSIDGGSVPHEEGQPDHSRLPPRHPLPQLLRPQGQAETGRFLIQVTHIDIGSYERDIKRLHALLVNGHITSLVPEASSSARCRRPLKSEEDMTAPGKVRPDSTCSTTDLGNYWRNGSDAQ